MMKQYSYPFVVGGSDIYWKVTTVRELGITNSKGDNFLENIILKEKTVQVAICICSIQQIITKG